MTQTIEVKPHQIPDIAMGFDDKKKLSPLLLKMHLEKKGFGQFMTTNDRTTDRFYFRNDENVLKIYTPENIRTFLIEELSEIILGDDKDLKMEAIQLHDLVSKYTDTSLKSQVLNSIRCFGEFDSEDAKPIQLAKDNPNTCFVRFINGVIVIDKDDISLVPYSNIEDKGLVWEKSIIPKKVEIDEERGLFEEFCFNAMKYNDSKISSTEGNWTEEYPITDSVKKNFEALCSAIGYLIHSDNSVQKAMIFIDRNSTITKEEGGNGKTVVMKAIQYFRDRMSVNGKQFYKGGGGDRFAFSGVTPSTGLIHIDDIDANFDFKSLFAFLTGDLEVEGKGTNKVIIPEDRKPKFGITTNYVLQGGGTSHARRQHIIEFGDYWNRCNQEGQNPWDEQHLGKRLFNDFSQKDWNQFYTFGFQCIKLYLEKGLIDGAMGSYEEKQLATSVASEPEVQEWIRNYVMETRVELNHHIDGIQDYKLYELFASDIEPMIVRNWDKTRFQKALYEYVSKLNGYDWNPHNSNKGDTVSARRWLKRDQDGMVGQIPWIKIVSDKDVIDDSVIVHKTDSSEIDELEDNLARFQRMLAS